MKPEIFDGGGSFENLYWTGKDTYGEGPRNTTDIRMEVQVGSEEEVKKKKNPSLQEEEIIMIKEANKSEEEKKQNKKTSLQEGDILS